MAKTFQTEREGQIKFFDDLKITADVELTNNTDGVYRGTLFEFKLTIANIDKVLFQAIKYLSHLRIKGASIPKNILLVSLNTETAYLFDSEQFLPEIEQIYIGASSRDNDKFDTKIKPEIIDFSSLKGLQKLTKILDTDCFTKINIDVFCVIGWAERFYSENPKATKIQLFEELRNPKHFANLIYAWNGDEQDFKYIMDCLNDRMHKKELGAFYTPPAYCKKATELVRKAIAQIPENHDYIILDRCAGTGNLEEFLTDKDVDEITISELDRYLSNDFKIEYLKDKSNIISAFYSDKDFNNITLGELEKYKTRINIRNYLFDNELSHCIVNTYELKEWLVLDKRIGDKVRRIIPPPCEVKNIHSVVKGGDALSANFILGKKTALFDMTDEYYEAIDELNEIVKNPKCNVIMLENPPFRDETSNSHMEGRSSETFVKTRMKEKIKGAILNDLSNQFIWSAWQYYLQKENDCYILFSPIKYWKSCELSNKKFIEGYIFNRSFFHTKTHSAITCILWKNICENRELLELGIWNIETKNSKEIYDDLAFDAKKIIEIKKVHNNLSKLYDKREDKTDKTDGIICGLNGIEDTTKSGRVIKKYNENIIGYLVAQQFGFENPRLSTNLTRCAIYNGNGFFLRKDNFIEKLPLFVAGKMPIEKYWWLNGIVFKTSDGGDNFKNDNVFLISCFIFTCLSYFNKCRSFNGSDGRFYRNELCFDEGTLASENLLGFQNLTGLETELLSTFSEVLKLAKATKNYNPKFAYGTYQIDNELNTRHKDENDTTIYDYPELNTKLIALKTKLAKYYEEVIQPKLFEYELLK